MILRSLLALAALALPAPTAFAQDGPPQAGSGALGGPVVAGVCLLSREAVFANAAIGQAAAARLQELTREAQAEIDAQRARIETEAQALEGAPDTADLRQRREQLVARWQDLQAQAAHDAREIEATRSGVLERISAETLPVIADVYRQRTCGLLFDRSTALGGNFANDLTAEVVRGLDARIQTISIERERLPRE